MGCSTYTTSTSSPRVISILIRHFCLVMTFSAARLRSLNLGVFPGEAPTRTLTGHDLLHKGSLAITVGQTTREEIGGTCYEGADLGKLRSLGFGVFFLVEALGVEDGTHFEKLKVALQFGGKVSLGEVIPRRTGGGFLLLSSHIWVSKSMTQIIRGKDVV